ncbi:MAG TPA: hypothetical protein VFW63_04770 [Acidimicrobiales bacterium]|nr:hypothetical protein [Acidimicrobiales bacterium]
MGSDRSSEAAAGTDGAIAATPATAPATGDPCGPTVLARLDVGDDPGGWRALGFDVTAGVATVGAVRLHLAGAEAGAGRGILGWSLRGGPAVPGDVDGLPTSPADASPGPGAPGDRPTPPGGHPNGAVGLDHLVVATPDLDRTTAALAAVGLAPRRTREAGGGRLQRFFRVGEVVLEVVGPAAPAGDGPAKFWGLAVTVADLDAIVALLGDRIGRPHAAVQPGRRIATVRADEAVSVPLAMMSPGPGGPAAAGR